MYNFIFWLFYKFYEWKDKDDSTLVPTAPVVISLIIHIETIFSTVYYLTGYNYSLMPYHDSSITYGQRKLIGLPIMLLLFFLVWYFYYRKKAKQILTKYEGKKALSLKNILLILLLMVLPLIISIQLTNLSVK